jgi:malonate-semialdehyde dehydrogenase (acetylating)/methylmalonate-semialdehyde dehydrogenase
MTSTITHWADGAPWQGSSERWGEVTNPATGEVTGRVALASAADAEHVITVADRAAREWRRTSLARRTQVMFAFRELLNAR